MTFPSPIDDSTLTVLLDVRSPQAYLALGPVAALASELGVAIDWLPLEAPPLLPPSAPAPDDDRGVRHRRKRAQAIAREIEIYGEAQGLVLRDFYRDPDPASLHLGWLWIREQCSDRLGPFVAESFRAYWALELDPSDPAAVTKLVDAHDGDGAEFRAWCADDGRAMATLLRDALRERGPSGVPGYLVENEFFYGRQHLPMIRWILEGRSGPVPI